MRLLRVISSCGFLATASAHAATPVSDTHVATPVSDTQAATPVSDTLAATPVSDNDRRLWPWDRRRRDRRRRDRRRRDRRRRDRRRRDRRRRDRRRRTPSPTLAPTPHPTPSPTSSPTPSPTPNPTPSPTPYPEGQTFEFLGCWVDNNDRGFSSAVFESYTDNAAVAVGRCQHFCKDYCYMAVQAGGECRCDSSPKFDDTYKQVADSECNQVQDCSVEYGCGAGWRNSVYANANVWSSVCADKTPGPPSLLPKFDFLGCWVDNNDRAFSEVMFSFSAHPTEVVRKCKEKCKNSCYMALQNSNECRCDSSPKFDNTYAQVEDSECLQKEDCSVQYGCGAAWRNSVYANSAMWSSVCASKTPYPPGFIPPTPEPTPSPTPELVYESPAAPCKKHKGHNKPRTTQAPSCTKIPVKFKLCQENKRPVAFYSNLAGKGPDKQEPEAFRMYAVAEVDGEYLDLAVSLAKDETYNSFSQNENKQYGGAYVSPCPLNKCTGDKEEPQHTGNCFGVIPFSVHSHTKFHWGWFKHGTNEKVEVEHFELTFTEIDHEKSDWDGMGADHEYVEFNTHSSTLEHGSRVITRKMPCGATRIESAEEGKSADNPSKMGALSVLNEERSVTVGYKNRADWYLTLGHEGPAGQIFDRSIEFTGAVYKCA